MFLVCDLYFLLRFLRYDDVIIFSLMLLLGFLGFQLRSHARLERFLLFGLR